MLEAIDDLQKKLYEAYTRCSKAVGVSDWGKGISQGRADAYLDAAMRLKAIVIRGDQSANTASP